MKGEVKVHYSAEIGDKGARTLFVRMDPGVFEALKPALTRGELPAVLNPPQWNGEGALWAKGVKSPLMSLTGVGPRFHTPGDVPAEVAGPELLKKVYQVIGKSVDLFMSNSVN